MKTVGALLLMLSFTCGGFYLSSLPEKRSVVLKECVSLLRFISSAIAYADEPLSEILSRALGSGEFQHLSFLQFDISQGFSAGWDKAVDSQADLDKKAAAALKAFGSKLGRSDRNGQLELCEFYKSELKKQLEALNGKKAEQVKAYRIIGSAVGVLLFIILL